MAWLAALKIDWHCVNKIEIRLKVGNILETEKGSGVGGGGGGAGVDFINLPEFPIFDNFSPKKQITA